ncbi:probable ubiquitin carboxyl-terminal hydrolase MINDY-4 [Acanthaster planci]|uniref:Ubiquitin carboxyl-terminal hydrolase MINDY n=1 Tax=Acanthaster planci TaxID=133434 RepID=A0A8B7XIS9_ACAPL|nr:probable ubiquitin carboxyl-terminal hydrolase MINDY-4 [Acanthaster planci]
MLDKDHVENVAASLVREYLSRKGLKLSLQSMDQELPRTDSSISNRVQLAREVHIEKLLKKNKEQAEPLRSMIEIITKYFLEKALCSSGKTEVVPIHGLQNSSPSSFSMKSRDTTSHTGKDSDSTTERVHQRVNNNSSNTGHKNKRKKKNSTIESSSKSSALETTDLDYGAGLPQEDLGGTYGLNRGSTPVITMKERPTVKEPEKYLESNEERLSAKHQRNGGNERIDTRNDTLPKRNVLQPGSSTRSRGLGGPITSSLDSLSRKKPTNKCTPTRTSLTASSFDPGLEEKPKSEKSSTNRDRLKDLGFKFDSPPKSNTEDSAKTITSETPQRRPESRTRRSVTDVDAVIGEDFRDRADSSPEQNQVDLRKSRGTSAKRKQNEKGKVTYAKQTLGDVELGDIDDLDDDLSNLQLKPTTRKVLNAVDGRPITQEQAIELKNVVFGSPSGAFNNEWRMQGLGFSDINKMKFGIIQHKGGPCGILASIQACFLQHLLYGENKTSTVSSLQPTSQVCSECLTQAICDIVWRAGEKRQAVIALPSTRAQFTPSGRYKPDGLTEKLVLNHFKKKEDLLEFVSGHAGVFESRASSGCILVLYSAIQSRTVDKVIEDMDEPTNRLMGAHGYCTQDMVNLLLTGRAVSNVFNDKMELDSGNKDKLILRGIGSRSDIGLLSLFEHYGSCKVGSNYKTPRYPIWVICSESHFSVLFCLKKELLNDWKVERRFDLYYYDGLSKQQDEIRLSIDTTQSCPEHQEEDLVPPLEHCIRTKWPDAVVNWNGTEPIL